MDDEEAVAERHLGRRTLAGGGRGFQGGRYEAVPSFQDEVEGDLPVGRKPLVVRPDQGREELSEEDQDAWDRIG
jgi:hypothetical protein